MKNHDMTFDMFIEDDSNRFAVAACRKVAMYPGEHYNPLWLYGPSGCGKTHLLNAICHQLQIETNMNVYYSSAEKAFYALLDSFDKKQSEWKHFETCDVLLLDNMDFFHGRVATQEEFIKLILTKCNHIQQVVVASGCPPTDVSVISDWIRKQEEFGLFSDITLPSKDLLRQFAFNYLHKHPFGITKNAFEYLIENTKSVPQLKGTLNSAQFCAYSHDKKIDLWWAKKHINMIMR